MVKLFSFGWLSGCAKRMFAVDIPATRAVVESVCSLESSSKHNSMLCSLRFHSSRQQAYVEWDCCLKPKFKYFKIEAFCLW